jgi:hypothetical protein
MSTQYKIENLRANNIEEQLNEMTHEGWSLKDRRLIPGSSPAQYIVVLQKKDPITSTTVEYDQSTGELIVSYDPDEVEIVSAYVADTGEVIVEENLLNP